MELRQTQRSAQLIFNNLEKICLTLRLSHKKWADLLGLQQAEYDRSYRTGCLKLPVTAPVRLASNLNLSLESLLTNTAKLDLKTLYEHFNGNCHYLPERYTVGAYSKRRTMCNILNHIELYFGYHERFRLLQKLQVPYPTLNMLDESININFAVDIMDSVSRNGISNVFFRELGIDSIRKTASLPFAKKIAEQKTIPDIFKCYLEEQVRCLEKNSTYRYIHRGNDNFIVEALQNEEVAEALKNKKYGSPLICEFKTGGLTHIPHYAGLPPVAATKIRCIHHGDRTCRWIVQYHKDSNVKQPSEHAPFRYLQ